MTQVQEPTAFQAPEMLRKLLQDEAIATAKYLEYKAKADEWEKYRNTYRTTIRTIVGDAPIVKIGDEVVLTVAPKGQFSGTRFAAEFPTLAEEYMRVQTKLVLDVEALAADHPDIAKRFTVVTFTNKIQ
jgi:hypothetical protein